MRVFIATVAIGLTIQMASAKSGVGSNNVAERDRGYCRTFVLNNCPA